MTNTLLSTCGERSDSRLHSLKTLSPVVNWPSPYKHTAARPSIVTTPHCNLMAVDGGGFDGDVFGGEGEERRVLIVSVVMVVMGQFGDDGDDSRCSWC